MKTGLWCHVGKIAEDDADCDDAKDDDAEDDDAKDDDAEDDDDDGDDWPIMSRGEICWRWRMLYR